MVVKHFAKLIVDVFVCVCLLFKVHGIGILALHAYNISADFLQKNKEINNLVQANDV